MQVSAKLEVILSVVLIIMSCAYQIESMPYSRWFDYDEFPSAKPIHEGEHADMIGLVNPLRPYEPWVLECIVFHSEKVEPGKRHPRCKELDIENEKEYAKFLSSVQEWETAYPERAARWNERFPDAKANEKKKYDQLKSWSDSHTKSLTEPDSSESVEMEMGENSSASSATTQRMPCSTSCPTTTTADAKKTR